MIRYLRNISLILLAYYLMPKEEVKLIEVSTEIEVGTEKRNKAYLGGDYIYVQDEDGLWAASHEDVSLEDGNVWHHFKLRKIQ